jgi:hypothetical protein
MSVLSSGDLKRQVIYSRSVVRRGMDASVLDRRTPNKSLHATAADGSDLDGMGLIGSVTFCCPAPAAVRELGR